MIFMSVVDDSVKNEYAYVFTNYFCLYLVYIYKLSEQILISNFFFTNDENVFQ